MTGSNPLSASALSRQVDVPQATLSKWLRNAGVESYFSYPNTQNRAVQMRPDVTKKSPNDWSPEEKLTAVLQAASLTDEQLGPFLRSKGLHEIHLQQWRLQMLDGLGKQPKRKSSGKSNPAQTKQIRDLEKELHRKDKALAETAALLVLKKKSGKSGGQGREYSQQERQMILELIDQAVSNGTRLHKVAEIVGLSTRTVIRWRKSDVGCDRRNGPRQSPANKLTEDEREQILRVANSPEYRDMSPKQIVPNLADQGIYVGSESTFYRILKEQQMVNHRRRSKPAVHHRPDEHAADGPCQVWSWDITYLRSAVGGMFYYLYMIIDVWSRKIMAATVYEEESMELSARLLARTCFSHGVNSQGLVLHSDNGGPMKGSTMQATL